MSAKKGDEGGTFLVRRLRVEKHRKPSSQKRSFHFVSIRLHSWIQETLFHLPGRWALALLLVVATAAGSGCSTHVLQRPVERRLKRRLETLIGPAQHYSVRISR